MASLVESPQLPLRLIVVDDEPLLRDLLASSLSYEEALTVVGSFGDSDSALAHGRDLQPDVAILDIDLPGSRDGIQLGIALREALPSLGIVLLSNHAMPHILASLPPDVVAGWSYLLKRSLTDLSTLTRAIVGAAEGKMTIDPALTADMAVRPHGVLAKLTKRQREVLDLIVAGYSNAAIANALVLTSKAVDKHIGLLYQQLELDTSDPRVQPRVRAVLKYLNETRTRWTAAMPAMAFEPGVPFRPYS